MSWEKSCEIKNKEIDHKLGQFYAEARTKESSLDFERYLNNVPFNRGISITKGTEFQSSNKLLQSQIKRNKREN